VGEDSQIRAVVRNATPAWLPGLESSPVMLDCASLGRFTPGLCLDILALINSPSIIVDAKNGICPHVPRELRTAPDTLKPNTAKETEAHLQLQNEAMDPPGPKGCYSLD
jgi:hypothetical protein